MPSAEIIIIGTEILLGEIPDTNARYIARHLRDIGVDLYRITIVGDNAQRIAQAIQQATSPYQGSREHRLAQLLVNQLAELGGD